MHEALRLCMKKWPGLEEGEQPKCTKTTQNARSSAPMHQKEPAHGKLTKVPQMHEALRLCMKNGRGLDKGWITLAAQNARSTAPVHQKQPSAREMHN